MPVSYSAWEGQAARPGIGRMGPSAQECSVLHQVFGNAAAAWASMAMHHPYECCNSTRPIPWQPEFGTRQLPTVPSSFDRGRPGMLLTKVPPNTGVCMHRACAPLQCWRLDLYAKPLFHDAGDAVPCYVVHKKRNQKYEFRSCDAC